MFMRLLELVRSQDQYGQSMAALNLKGRDSLQTVSGGIITILTTAAFLYLTLEI